MPADSFRQHRLSVEHAVALFLALSMNSARTEETYRTQLRRFIDRHRGQDFANVIPHDIRRDVKTIICGVKGSPNARNRDGVGAAESYITVLRSMYSKLESLLPPGTGNPARAVPLPKRVRLGEREHYTSWQLAHIFLSVQPSNEWRLFTLMLSIIRTTGVRRKSLVDLNLEDIDFATGETTVRGKGIVYHVYLSDILREMILDLFRDHRGLTEDEMTAVLRSVALSRARGLGVATRYGQGAYDPETGEGGTPALWTRRGSRVTRKTAERLIKAVRKGLPEGVLARNFDLHSLRHTYIEQLRSNFNEDAVRGLAGHRSMKSGSTTATSDYTMTRRGKAIDIQGYLFGPRHRFGIQPPADDGAD